MQVKNIDYQNKKFNDRDNTYNASVESFLNEVSEPNSASERMVSNIKVKIIGDSTKYPIWDKEYEFTIPEGVNQFQR